MRYIVTDALGRKLPALEIQQLNSLADGGRLVIAGDFLVQEEGMLTGTKARNVPGLRYQEVQTTAVDPVVFDRIAACLFAGVVAVQLIMAVMATMDTPTVEPGTYTPPKRSGGVLFGLYLLGFLGARGLWQGKRIAAFWSFVYCAVLVGLFFMVLSGPMVLNTLGYFMIGGYMLVAAYSLVRVIWRGAPAVSVSYPWPDAATIENIALQSHRQGEAPQPARSDAETLAALRAEGLLTDDELKKLSGPTLG